MTHNNEQEHTQEVEWEKQYCTKFGLCQKDDNCQCRKEILFIRKLLAQHNKDMVELVESKRMKFKPGEAKDVMFEDPSAVDGYNQAVDDIKKLLTHKE